MFLFGDVVLSKGFKNGVYFQKKNRFLVSHYSCILAKETYEFIKTNEWVKKSIKISHVGRDLSLMKLQTEQLATHCRIQELKTKENTGRYFTQCYH